MNRLVTVLLLSGLAALGPGAAVGQVADIDPGDRVVVTGMAPIPDVGPGAPRFTSQDIEAIVATTQRIFADASADIERCLPKRSNSHVSCNPNSLQLPQMMACERDYSFAASNLALKAADATRSAEDARRAVAAGTANMKSAETAELDRQAAVNSMLKARKKLTDTRADIGVWQDAFLSPAPRWNDGAEMEKAERRAQDKVAIAQARRNQRGREPVSGVAASATRIEIEGVTASSGADAKGQFLLVRGQIRNPGAGSPVYPPPLSGLLLDERGGVLMTVTVESRNDVRLSSNEVRPFQFIVRSAPLATSNVAVVFGQPDETMPRLPIGNFCSG